MQEREHFHRYFLWQERVYTEKNFLRQERVYFQRSTEQGHRQQEHQTQEAALLQKPVLELLRQSRIHLLLAPVSLLLRRLYLEPACCQRPELRVP